MQDSGCDWLIEERLEEVVIYRHPSAPLWIKVDEENDVVKLEYSEDLEDYIQELLDTEGGEEEARDVLEEILEDMARCAAAIAREREMVVEGLEETRYDVLAVFDDLVEEQFS